MKITNNFLIRLIKMKINELKHDLAAAFRWTARLNMNEGIANHFSVCLPNSNDFYVNGSGLHFSKIKASDLVLVKQDDFKDLKNKPEIVDPTALNIHGTCLLYTSDAADE